MFTFSENQQIIQVYFTKNCKRVDNDGSKTSVILGYKSENKRAMLIINLKYSLVTSSNKERLNNQVCFTKNCKPVDNGASGSAVILDYKLEEGMKKVKHIQLVKDLSPNIFFRVLIINVKGSGLADQS